MLFTFARKAPRRYVLANPAAEIGVANIKARQHTLGDPEIKLLWNACNSLGQYSKILKLLLLTGARLTEIGHLRWSETDFAERILILPPGRTKTDTPHLMPLSEPAMAILNSIEAGPARSGVPHRQGPQDRQLEFSQAAARQHAWQGGAAVARA